MRIFVGIKLNLSEILSDVKKQLTVHSYGQIKWVKNENLHLTLVFIGQMTQEKIFLLTEALGEALKKQSVFYVQSESIGLFTKRHGKSILWLGIKPSERLNELQKIISEVCCDILPGLVLQYEFYTPHITLARYNGKLTTEHLEKENLKRELCIDEVQIMESKSKPEGVEYQVIENFRL